MKKEMLVNVLQPEESRIAVIEDGVLEELYVERTSLENYVGNIYKGRIVNVEPSIQAAFVDFGVGRNGFLHISDVEPQYFRQGGFDPDEPGAFGGGRMADIDVGDDEPSHDDEEHDDDDAPRPQIRLIDRRTGAALDAVSVGPIAPKTATCRMSLHVTPSRMIVQAYGNLLGFGNSASGASR